MNQHILDVTRAIKPRMERRTLRDAFRSGAGLPFLTGIALAMLLATEFHDFSFLGYQSTGWAWVIISVVSLVRLIGHSDKVRFPIWIWLPWSAYVFIWTFAGSDYAWQSTSQILCPTLAGMAASTYSYSGARLLVVAKAIRTAYYIYLIGVVFVDIPYALSDVSTSGRASGAISLLFFQAWFLAQYLVNGRKRRDLLLYLSAIATLAIGANRGPLLASVVLAVFALLPISLPRRVMIAASALVIGILVFYTPKVQNKMFFSGHGTLADMRSSNPDLRTNGRAAMWRCLETGSAEKPWFGHGGNADRTRLLQSGFVLYLPHNDWLRLRFNYGFIGLALYAATLLAQILHARRTFQIKLSSEVKAMAGAGLTCFVAYVVVMYTDNVLIYCQYFTVPMMLLLGTAYSARLSKDALIRRAPRQFQHMAPARRLVR